MNPTYPILSPTKPGREFFVILSGLLLIGNIVFIIRAIGQGGWAAMGWLFMVSPVFNGVMLLAGIVKTITLERNRRGWNYSLYWLLSIFLPLIMITISLGVLLSGVTGGGC